MRSSLAALSSAASPPVRLRGAARSRKRSRLRRHQVLHSEVDEDFPDLRRRLKPLRGEGPPGRAGAPVRPGTTPGVAGPVGSMLGPSGCGLIRARAHGRGEAQSRTPIRRMQRAMRNGDAAEEATGYPDANHETLAETHGPLRICRGYALYDSATGCKHHARGQWAVRGRIPDTTAASAFPTLGRVTVELRRLMKQGREVASSNQRIVGIEGGPVSGALRPKAQI